MYCNFSLFFFDTKKIFDDISILWKDKLNGAIQNKMRHAILLLNNS